MNNSSKKVFWLLYITFFLFTTSGCSQDKVNPIFLDSILYIEGKELSAGSFGDIVMLDPIAKKKVKITNDFHYDSSPFFNFSSDEIIFLSKRRKNDHNHGLGKDDDVYSYELESKRITKIPFESNAITDLFYVSKYNEEKIINEYTLKGGHLLWLDGSGEILRKDRLFPYRDTSKDKFFFDEREEFFIAQFFDESKELWHNTIKLYELNNLDKADEILDEFIDEDLGKLSEVNCYSGSFVSSEEFIFSCNVRNLSKIFKYNFKKNTLETIFKSTTQRIINPQKGSSSDYIYFIGIDSESKDEEIWLFDPLKNKSFKITSSNTDKKDLRVY
jgi:hypothetical protein